MQTYQTELCYICFILAKRERERDRWRVWVGMRERLRAVPIQELKTLSDLSTIPTPVLSIHQHRLIEIMFLRRHIRQSPARHRHLPRRRQWRLGRLRPRRG